jgi:hypothetical protein
METFFLPAIEYCLGTFIDAFNTSLDILKTESGLTPNAFSPFVVAILRGMSTTIMMPVAGLILAYIFCLELIQMITERNNMAEFDIQGVFWLILKTTVAIILISNSFDIALAFFDVGAAMVNNSASYTNPTLAIAGLMDGIKDDIGGDIGTGLILTLFCFLALLGGFVGCGLIYLVAWTRIVMILIYISVAPVPLATLMSNSWVGEIGKNYLKNLAALALQGFLMVVCMIIYGGLVTHIMPTIVAQGATMGIVTMLVGMFVCVRSLMACLTLAKSIFGAI